MPEPVILRAQWPAPDHVCAATTTRRGGVSHGDFASLNLGARTADYAEAVARNRSLLAGSLQLPGEPAWLEQVHGTRVVAARDHARGSADAAWTRAPGEVCVVLTADCLPVLFCDQAGTVVAAAHAGWRGLVAGVLEATITAMSSPPASLLAWIGPGIGAAAFEVGDEVRQAFVAADVGAAGCFEPSPAGRWLADLEGLARRRLAAAGVGGIYGGGCCTFSDAERFYSHRRCARTGRMASLIWLSSGS